MSEKYQTILETYDTGQIAFLKSLLDANGIDYVVDNEHVATFMARSGIPLVLKVAEQDLEKTRELLGDFQQEP